MFPRVASISIFPVKSLRGIELQQSDIYPEGLERDRQWMLTDKSGNFLSQRTFPVLSQIETVITKTGIRCIYSSNTGVSQHLIPFQPKSFSPVDVKVWKDEFIATRIDDELGHWFSEILGQRVNLVYSGDPQARIKKLAVEPFSTPVRFADGYPILIMNEASLLDLNGRLQTPVSKDRFRANIWLKNLHAYKEEQLDEFSIGEARFKMIKPCARCVMINIDPETGKSSKEPLSTLSGYKKSENKVSFGMNAICLKKGKIECGQKLIL